MTQLTSWSEAPAPAARASVPTLPVLTLPSIKEIFPDAAQRNVLNNITQSGHQWSLLSAMSYYPCVKVHPDDYIGQFVWSHLKGKSLATWRAIHGVRNAAREPYGGKIAKKQSSTGRRATTLSVQDQGHLSKKEGKRRIARIHHAIKEQHRRVRHRVLNSWMDKQCSEFHFGLGGELIALVKDSLGHEPSRSRKCNQSETGKDLNLTTTLCSLVMSNWIIAAQCELMRANANGTPTEVIIASFEADPDIDRLLYRNSSSDLPFRPKTHYVSCIDLTPPPSSGTDSESEA